MTSESHSSRLKTILFITMGLSILSAVNATTLNPADIFDLSRWSITLPLDDNRDGRADVIKVSEIQNYSHPDFFHLDKNKHLVFTAPNKAVTTANSTNTRSELRQMIAGADSQVRTRDPANNFALKAHKHADKFAMIGGRMEATLRVNHVARNAGHPNKYAAYSAVVGQIHATKSKQKHGGFGWGNEPLKIFYKKWPEHKTGSIFWTYERNLPKTHPDRTDIIYPVWGNTWDVKSDPGSSGVALDQEFSYSVNVYQNTMYLTFETADKKTVQYQINLSNNVDAHGKTDVKDLTQGYTHDTLYFKAGAYNQCSTRDTDGMWYPACQGTGNWNIDQANGDFVRVTFSKLVLSNPKNPEK